MNKEYTDKDGKIYIVTQNCPKCFTGTMKPNIDGYGCVQCGRTIYLDKYNPPIVEDGDN